MRNSRASSLRRRKLPTPSFRTSTNHTTRKLAAQDRSNLVKCLNDKRDCLENAKVVQEEMQRKRNEVAMGFQSVINNLKKEKDDLHRRLQHCEGYMQHLKDMVKKTPS